MPEGIQFVIFAVIAALILVGAYKAYVAKRQRPIQLGALADRLHWSFDPNADDTHDHRYGHFAVFVQGHSRCAFNTLQGAIDIDGTRWPVRMGDYRYRTTSSNGKQTTTVTHCLSYAIIETPHLGAPDLFLRRERMLD